MREMTGECGGLCRIRVRGLKESRVKVVSKRPLSLNVDAKPTGVDRGNGSASYAVAIMVSRSASQGAKHILLLATRLFASIRGMGNEPRYGAMSVSTLSSRIC